MQSLRTMFGIRDFVMRIVLPSCLLVVTSSCRDGLNEDDRFGESETSGGFGRSWHPVTGKVVSRPSDADSWKGMGRIETDKTILIMPGHSDAQCPEVGGSGTPGLAVGKSGAKPMSKEPNPVSGRIMTDELYWAIEIAKEVVRQGNTPTSPDSSNPKLNIQYYDPVVTSEGADRCIEKPDNPAAAWARGAAVAAQGGYALEIHLDAWSPHGSGSGLIPRANKYLPTQIDEALAQEFGRYPKLLRGGLGGPRRGVSFLEIGKLEDPLEGLLRNPSTRERTIRCTSKRIVDAIRRGLHLDQAGSAKSVPLDNDTNTDCGPKAY